MLTQIVLIVLSTMMTTMGGAILWMLKDRLRMAKTEGEVNAHIQDHGNRIASLEEKSDEAVSRREHEDLQKAVSEGMKETREDLRSMRQDISRMAGIMARATGETS